MHSNPTEKGFIMTSENTFYRTTATITILSEYEIPDGMDIASIVRNCEDGDFVMGSQEWKIEKLTGEQMSEALFEAGSEPGFFDLD